MSMPRFYCPTPLATGLALSLPAGAARHVQVLRLQPGDVITLFNGEGGEFDATVTRMGRSDVDVEVGEHRPVEREAARAVHPGMAWSWAGGRKFTKIEVTNSTWTAPTFNVHLGSTGCTGTNPAAGQVDTCSRPNRVDFGFASFNPTTQKVAVDVKALLSGNNVTVNGGGPTGCMSGNTDPECGEIFKALSLDLTAGTTLNGGLNQRLFKVVSK